MLIIVLLVFKLLFCFVRCCELVPWLWAVDPCFCCWLSGGPCLG